MSAILYARISKKDELLGLRDQESVCRDYASENSLRIRSSHKEVNNSINKNPPVLHSVVKMRNVIIIMADVLKISKNIKLAMEIASISNENNNKIIFIKENFMCRNSSDLPKLEKLIQNAINAHELNDDKQPLHEVPYGFELSTTLIRNETEQSIIEFIKLCKGSNVRTENLNNRMNLLLESMGRSNQACITCYNNDDKVIIEHIIINNTDIASILNTHGIECRNRKWKVNMIEELVNSLNVRHVNTKWCNLCDLNQS
jgi:hypothetical protein